MVEEVAGDPTSGSMHIFFILVPVLGILVSAAFFAVSVVVDRIHSIVREVGGFSSENSREDFLQTSFDQIVACSLRIAQLNAPYRLMIEKNFDPEVRIDCHSEEIERAVTNLLVNSMRALEGNLPGTGHLALAVAAIGDRAVLHVEDDGGGIDAEVLDRIFDPFFATKPAGKGMGLGLAISYHIVKGLGGDIRVCSVPGRGTSVSVELPLAGRFQ